MIIPDTVKTIGDYAFSECSSLTNVTIGDSVSYIGKHAFEFCTSLTSVTFENPNGWWITRDETATSGTNISATDLADPTISATYLKSRYCGYPWYRD